MYTVTISRGDTKLASFECDHEKIMNLMFEVMTEKALKTIAEVEKKPKKERIKVGGFNMEKYEGKTGRVKISDTVRHGIEDMIIEGKDVAAIALEYEVSRPTVYVIKARLKKEGKI